VEEVKVAKIVLLIDVCQTAVVVIVINEILNFTHLS